MEQGYRRSSTYERITDQIVEAIEAGAADYVMPWHRQSNGGLPRNAFTRQSYRGINVVALWSVAQARGYPFHSWATYLQWKEVGAQVRRGEVASPIVFYKPREERTQTELLEDDETKFVLQYSAVFNALQVEGWTPPSLECVNLPGSIMTADSFVDAIGAEVIYGFDRASYNAKLDRICMPDARAFTGTRTSTATESYYSVLLHEHVHWSGNDKRLDRDLKGRFGTSAYAMEELIAELGAAFLCAEIGLNVEPRVDHAAYIATWLQVLKDQPTAIFAAAGKAATACTYLADMVRSKR